MESKNEEISFSSPIIPFTEIPLPLKNITVTSEIITEEHQNFCSKHSGDSYNPIELKLNAVGSYCVTIRAPSTILGQIICIPHTIWVEGIGAVKTALSTYLVVHTKFRGMKLAQSVIMAAMKEAYIKQINMGHHWIKDQREELSIKSAAWYRPLLIKKARALDYEIIKKTDYTLLGDEKCRAQGSFASDFSYIESNSNIRLVPNSEELEKLTEVITFLTILYHKEPPCLSDCGYCVNCVGKIIGIVGYRPFTIVKPGLTFEACQLCYFDSLPSLAATVLTETFIYLKHLRFVAVHGVFMSGIDKVADKMCLSITNDMFLDFYNLKHNISKCNKVSMLYF
jgi:hypothetical protein